MSILREFLFLIIPHLLHLQMSNNIPGLETENDSGDVDIKHEPLEPDVDDYVSTCIIICVSEIT